jgi:ABC-type nitrate/sulfonate/bicarbonate transport system substrate-binding protein
MRGGYQIGVYMGVFYVAVDRKFLEEEGLTNFDHKYFATGPLQSQALSAQQIDVAFGMGTLPGVNARAQGIPMVFLGTINQCGEVILLRKDLVGKVDPRRADHIKGLTIALPAKANQQDYLLRLWLEKLGLDPSRDVKIVFVPFGAPQGAALARKDIDIAVSNDPIATQQQLDGLGDIIVTGQEIAPNHDSAGIAVDETWLKKNPAQATAIVRGMDKALTWARANPDQYYEIVAKWTKVKPDVIKDVVQGKRNLIPEKLAPQTSFYYDMASWLLRAGYVEKDPKTAVDAYLCCWRKYQEAAGVLR